VVQDVPIAIDRLAGDRCRQMAARGVERDLETLIESMAGLAAKNQLIQPIEQKLLGGSGQTPDLLLLTSLSLPGVWRLPVEQPRSGRVEKIHQVVGEHSQSQVGRVLEGFRLSHQKNTSFKGRNARNVRRR